jgi:HK97 family phage portal protein
MSFIERLANVFGFEKRALGSGGYFENYMATRASYLAGANPDAAISNSAVAHRCVALCAETIASLPLNVFRRTKDGGRERAEDHPLDYLLGVAPNDYQSVFEFREHLLRSYLMHGNAVARIESDDAGRIRALHPAFWHGVQIERLPSGRLRYGGEDVTSHRWTLLQEDVLHIRGPSRDGVTGLSPLQLAPGAIGLALSYAETAQALSDNRLSAGGVYSVEGNLTEEQHKKLLKFIGRHVGPANAGSPLIVDHSAKWMPHTFSPLDAQFLESRKLSNEDVARAFGVPPTSVGIPDKNSYNLAEQEALMLVRNCLSPLAARSERALERCLLTSQGRRNYFFEHDFSALLRGDIKARFEAYRLAREVGAFSPNDIRRRENEPPIEGGDVYHVPVNWAPLGDAPIGDGAGEGTGA